MIDLVETVGRSVESVLPGSPDTARHLLQASYGWVALSGALKRGCSYDAAMDRFNGMLARTIVAGLTHPEEAALVNLFMPCQILAGLHLTPLFPEALSVYVANTCCAGCFGEAAEACGVPESLCSYHKVMLGMAQAQVLRAPACIANTTLACDANQVTFRALARRFDVPRFVVDVPHAADERATEHVERRLFDLVAFLERATGRRFDQDAFLHSMDLSARTLETMRAYRDLRGSASLPTTTSGELMEMMATHLMLGTQASLDLACDLLAAAKRAPRREPDGKPRVFWVHTLPNWQRSMRDVFDGADAACELVGNDMTLDAPIDLDPAHPMRALARRIVGSHFNGAANRRIDDVAAEARSARADGVVVFCHWGCKTTMGLAQLAQARLEEAGLPVLVLDGDGCDPRNVSDGQMVTRVNAFIESLAARKEGR